MVLTELLVLAAIVLAVYVVWTKPSLRPRFLNDSWNRAYSFIAKKYGGYCMPAGWWTRPTVNFTYGEARCVLGTIRTNVSGGGEFTKLAIGWPQLDLQLEVMPRWRSTALWISPGMNPVATHDDLFDKQFLVRCNKPKAVQRFLSPEIRQRISSLYSLFRTDDVYIMANPALVVIKKPGFIKTQVALDEFVRDGLDLFDHIRLTRSVGIDFVERALDSPIDDITCQICGEAIQADRAICRRCKTPHCRECWEYAGQCSTYACGENQYLAVKN